MLDLVIRHGIIVDGTGTARFQADIGVLDGRIVQIGSVTDHAKRTFDATDLVVAPGFIDVHTHYDVQGFWDPYFSPSPLHGITTVFAGNCGFSVAPLSPLSRDYIMRTLARVEGMPLAALEAGVPWDWTTTEEYLGRLDGKIAINAGFLVGHTALRRFVMLDEASTRAASATELLGMANLLRDGLKAGGMGFSTSRGAAHFDANGDPVPSRHARPEECISLAAVCREYPGTSLEFIPGHRPFSEEDRMIATMMSVRANRPLNWNVMNSRAETLERDLANLGVSDHAAGLGSKIVGLAIPMDIDARLSFGTGFNLDSIPGWAKTLALPHSERLAALSSPTERARLFAYSKNAGDRAELADWGNKVIVDTTDPALKHYQGLLVREIAAQETKEPFDALLDIVCRDKLRTTFSRPPHDSAADWEARARIWRDDRTIIGGSDAGAHVDYLATFQYSTTFLSNAVRLHNIFSLEDGIQQLTSRPADLYGLRNRGRLVEGSFADVVVFDKDRVCSGPVFTKADLPAGATRFYSEGVGISEVFVNGVSVVSEGEFTGATPGKLLRGGTDTQGLE